MLDAAVKALTQILSPPMRTILWRSIGLALVMITVLAIGLQRLLSWFAEYGEGWAEAMLGPGYTPINVLAWIVSTCARPRRRARRHFLMPAITSLVASVFVDDVADHVEREHYPAEAGHCATARCRDPRGRQDRAADDPGLSGRAAVRAVRGRWISDLLHRHRLAAGPGIFRTRGDAIPFAGGSQGDAQGPCRHRVHRRAHHRGLRVDPGRQPGDAVVRHGPDGSHAQAVIRPAPELLEPEQRTGMPVA